MALEHLLGSVAPDVCFWYAHPWDEDLVKGNRVGEFFGADTSRLIHLTNDDIWQVCVTRDTCVVSTSNSRHTFFTGRMWAFDAFHSNHEP